MASSGANDEVVSLELPAPPGWKKMGGDTKRRKMDMDLDIQYVEYWTNNEADFIKLLEQACLGDYSMGNPELKVDLKDFWCNFTSELRRRCEIPIHVTDEAVQSCMEYANVSLRKKYRGYEGSSGAVLDAGTRDRLNNIFGKCNLYFPPVFTSVSSQSGRSRSSDASVPNYSNPVVRPIPDCLKAELAAAYHQLRNDGVMNAKDCGKVDTFISMTEVTILWFLRLSQTDKEIEVRNILRN